MGFNTFEDNLQVIYFSKKWSKATIFNLTIFFLALILPYIISYTPNGFWRKLELIREQPKVEFKHEGLIILETMESTEDIIWTTFPGLYQMISNKVLPFISSRESDIDRNGLNDFVEIEMIFPLLNGENVTGITAVFLFDYLLKEYADFHMESMVYTNYYSCKKAGNSYELIADLDLVQKEPFYTNVRDIRYETPVVSRTSNRLDDYTLENILRNYAERNVSTNLKNKFEIWGSGTPEGNYFTLKIKIFYSQISYESWAGFWESMKWAWIQYLAVLVIVYWALEKFRRNVYRSRMFETLLFVPWEKKSIHSSS